MKDSYNREINYLRVSLTDRCNLRCLYCMPKEGVCLKKHEDMLSEDELIETVKVAATLGINKIRLTGGEPLIKKNIISIVKRIREIKEIKDLAITTNATYLKNYARDLKDNGVNRLNISLDTLDKDKYEFITRGGNINEALEGIKEAIEVGFEKIKINVVLIGGFNDDEIEALANLTIDNDIDVRFIEMMPMVNYSFNKEAYISNQIVLDKLDLIPLNNDGVARLYKLKGAKGNIGLISPISNSFCSTCNRLRLSADGKIKVCLHSNKEINIKGLSIDDKKQALIEAINNKPKEHKELSNDLRSEANISMNEIGG